MELLQPSTSKENSWTISLVSNPRITATDSYNIPVGLCRPLILVKQHQIFTKWLFGSDLHNTYQGSALVSRPINRCLRSTQRCAILFLVTQEKGKDQKDTQVYKNKTKHNKKDMKESNSASSWSSGSFFYNKSPKGQADMVSPQQPFSLFPLFSVLEPSWNHCGETKAL